MIKEKIVIVSGDDWIGIYVGGKLVDEGHSISGKRLLQILGIHHEVKEANSDWLSEVGNLPQNLTDVKWIEN